MRCLIGFYGLNRSLRWTAHSIIRNVIRPLRRANVDANFAAHFNEPTFIRDDRTGETGIRVRREGVNQLPLDFLIFEEQSVARLPTALIQAIKKLPEGSNLAPLQTMLNLIWQLYSLNQLWRLAQLTPDCYDAYIFLRPDMEYLDPFEGSILEPIKRGEADLITASWGQWGGLNDRFAVCSPRGAEVYAQRLALCEQYIGVHRSLHAENFLQSVASEACLKLRYMNIRALRVRADGATIRGEFDISAHVILRGLLRKRFQKARTLIGNG